jgi:hypothetical protein
MDFAFPLEGVLNADFFYIQYMDHDGGTGVRDYECREKSYDGHTGTDIALASFRKMDEGVTIVAAATGVVTHAEDGNFDRNTVNGPGGLGNFVRIAHRDGFASFYGHMTQGSVTPSVGDVVAAGDPLGLVGSSGNSDIPHLHIEFHRDGVAVDAFAGACVSGRSQWLAPDEYQDERFLIESGTTDLLPTLDLIKGPPVQKDTFRTDDARLSAWVQIANVTKGSASRFAIYQPNGQLFWEYIGTHPNFWGMSWWWIYHDIPGWMTQTGTWRVTFANAGEVLLEREFEIVAPPVAARSGSMPAPPELRQSGFGGGGAGRSF